MDKEKFNRLLKYLPADKQERCKRFRSFEDAQRTLLGDILARYMVWKITKQRFHEIVFDTNSYGKPRLRGNWDLEFNVSHSGEYIAAAINTEALGIDIEEIKPIDISIARDFFTEKEYLYIMNGDVGNSNRLERFYEIWTLKESYIKAVGRGLSIPLNSFNISMKSGSIVIETESGPKDYYFKQYDFDSNYKMAVCTTGREYGGALKIFTLEEFYDEMCSICRNI